MILLNESHREALLDFLLQEPYVNLFLIGDLELYGFDSEIQEYYAHFESGEMVSVLFRYLEMGTHLYAKQIDEDVLEWVRHYVKEHPTEDFLMGDATAALVNGRLDDLFKGVNETKMAVYKPNDTVIDVSAVEMLRALHAEDITEIQCEAFGGNRPEPERLASAIANGETRVYGVWEGDELAAVGSYTAKTKEAAMIIGVATRPQFREKGYASAVVKRMSDDLYEQGCQGVLFYDNPKAARIYERMGYTFYTRYFMNELKR